MPVPGFGQSDHPGQRKSRPGQGRTPVAAYSGHAERPEKLDGRRSAERYDAEAAAAADVNLIVR